MLNFAEQTGSGAVIVVWLFLAVYELNLFFNVLVLPIVHLRTGVLFLMQYWYSTGCT